jgi:hypothetical protein
MRAVLRDSLALNTEYGVRQLPRETRREPAGRRQVSQCARVRKERCQENDVMVAQVGYREVATHFDCAYKNDDY